MFPSIQSFSVKLKRTIQNHKARTETKKEKPSQDCFLSAACTVKTRLRAVVVDPEVVFVANLMKADAPALVASFQCDFTLQAEEDGTQNMRANLRELKVLACPFIQNKEDKAVTTVRVCLFFAVCRFFTHCYISSALCFFDMSDTFKPTAFWSC